MYFYQFNFILLFIVSYFIYTLLNNPKHRKYYLIVISLLYYSYITGYFVFALISVLLLNYFFIYLKTIKINKKLVLNIAFISNLICFLMLKEFRFFSIYNISKELIYAVGVSYYILQSLSAVIDVHESEVEKPSFVDFTLYVTFYPQLILGPIIRLKKFILQLETLQPRLAENYKQIFTRILIAFIQKNVLAANLFVIVSPIYRSNFDYSSTTIIVAHCLSYLALYLELSSYISIVISISQAYGIIVPESYNSPLFAKNIAERWSRWNMTYTYWVRDYLFWPLMRFFNTKWNINKKTTALGLYLVFLFTGFWHKLELQFFVWANYHFIGFVIYILWKEFSRVKLHNYLAVFLTYLYFSFSVIIYKFSPNDYIEILIKTFLNFNGVQSFELIEYIYIVSIVLICVAYKIFNFQNYIIKSNWIKSSFIFAILIHIIILFSPAEVTVYEYFKY